MASWGSFAGGLAQGALQSFSALSRLNREEREMALREEQAAIARAEAAQKDEYGRLLAQSRMPGGVEGTGQGVGQALGGLSSQDVRPNVSGAPALTPEGKAELQQALSKLPPEQATQALRAYGQAYGTPTEGAPDLSKATVYTDKAGQQFATEQVKERTPMEASRRMMDLSAQAGNPYAYEKALGMHATQMQLNKLERDDKFDAQFDAWRTKFNTQAAADRAEFAETAKKGPQAILDKYGAEFTKETGQTASLNKDLITLKDKSGKVVGSFPAAQLGTQIEPLLAQKYLRNMTSSMMENGLVRNATEAYNFLKAESEIRNQGLTASASMISALSRQATVESEIERNRASAQESRAKAGYWSSGGSGAGKTSAPQALRDTAKDMVAKGEAKDIDSAVRLLKGKDARSAFEIAWEKRELELIKAGQSLKERALERAALQEQYGYAPAAKMDALRAGSFTNAKGKQQALTRADVDEFNDRYPASAVDPDRLPWLNKKTEPAATEGKPSTAIPAGKPTPAASNFYSGEAIAARKREQEARIQKEQQTQEEYERRKAMERRAIYEDMQRQ